MLGLRMRSKGQVTIPIGLIEAAQLKEDTMFDVAYIKGVITLTPKPSEKSGAEDIMSYAGILRTTPARSAAEIDASLAQIRGEWDR